jgi:serine/threonine-protein kinase
MSTAESPSLTGMKYQVEKILSSEGPSTVMLVSDPRALSKRYVVKRIAREDEKQDPLLALAAVLPEASSKLNHPGVLAYHDFALKKAWFKTTGGELLMDYIESKPLDKLGKNVSVKHWVLIFRQVASALAHMHRRKVLHGNLEPRHVLLGRTGHVKLINYGLGAVEPGHRPATAKLFSAPEVVKEDRVIEPSDVYSLGCLMYALLTGKSPAAAKKAETEGVKGAAPAQINPNIPASLSNLIVHCMKSHAPNRPPGPYEVQQELEPIVAATKLDDDALAGLAFEEA